MNRILVGVPVYSKTKIYEIKRCLDSLTMQSYNADILVFLDGPVDQELKSFLTTFMKLHDGIILESPDNRGLAASLNTIIEWGLNRGYEFFARMDSDDISRKERFRYQINYLDTHPEISVLGGYCSEFGSNYAKKLKKVPLCHEEIISFSKYRCPFIHPTVMFRFSLFAKGYRYSTNTHLTEDMSLWINLILSGEIKFANLDHVLLDYHIADETLTRRIGFAKALSEANERIRYLTHIKSKNPFNYLIVILRASINVLPLAVIRIVYKRFR